MDTKAAVSWCPSEIGVLKKFPKLTGKRLGLNLFLNKVTDCGLQEETPKTDVVL